MLGRGDGADYPLGADLYPFCAKVNRERVGASLLAMGVNDDADCLEVRGALESIAGKPVSLLQAHVAVNCRSELARDGR
ncbi:hypothetical protein PMA3_10970 [Pseudomonas silesiensis]|jgi:hypothetical protein|uniref:Uncharacterized protein n=1 Tax=Pseudomonas silesiensis TaxID=1853130 RepID=A0A191YRY1_9PSED|nr:hypothetical protein PMA3_10970 [Pseudomonas silesiensis]